MNAMIRRLWAWVHSDLGDGVITAALYMTALVVLRWLMWLVV